MCLLLLRAKKKQEACECGSVQCRKSDACLKHGTYKMCFEQQRSSHILWPGHFVGIQWPVPHSSYTLHTWNSSKEHDGEMLLGHQRHFEVLSSRTVESPSTKGF